MSWDRIRGSPSELGSIYAVRWQAATGADDDPTPSGANTIRDHVCDLMLDNSSNHPTRLSRSRSLRSSNHATIVEASGHVLLLACSDDWQRIVLGKSE